MRVIGCSGFIAFFSLAGCYGAVVEPGHRGLIFNSRNGGLQHEVLAPGYHKYGYWGRMDDFDVTFSTRKEEVKTTSAENNADHTAEHYNLDVRAAVIYRPIISELYELDTEIGATYYEEVIGPEFKSSIRGVMAHHSYTEMQSKNTRIEDEVEEELRRRLTGRHIEIASVTLDSVALEGDVEASIRARHVAQQDDARRKITQAAQNEAEQRAIENDAKKAEMRARSQLLEKEQERKIAAEQAMIDRTKAETEAAIQITKAKADSEETKLMAVAHAEEHRADRHTLTPLAVMDHAYEALGKLGGTGTSIMLGDWSHVPQFLFPHMPAFNGAMNASPSAMKHTVGPMQTLNPFPTVTKAPMKASVKGSAKSSTGI